MKTKLFQISRAAALAICAFGAAQLDARSLPFVKMTVPFDFVVSGKTMPAGEYQMFGMSNQAATPAFIIRNTRTHRASIAVMSQRSAGTGAQAEVTFLCRDAKCYLREMKTSGMESFIAPVPISTKVEKERMTSIPLLPGINAD